MHLTGDCRFCGEKITLKDGGWMDGYDSNPEICTQNPDSMGINHVPRMNARLADDLRSIRRRLAS